METRKSGWQRSECKSWMEATWTPRAAKSPSITSRSRRSKALLLCTFYYVNRVARRTGSPEPKLGVPEPSIHYPVQPCCQDGRVQFVRGVEEGDGA
eukprot:14520160-Alexandrium_andersonii.AAC.1